MTEAKIKLNTHPYTHNLFTELGDKEGVQAYSGPFVVRAQQWGALAVYTNTPAWTPNGGMISPVVCPDPQGEPVFQPPAATRCNGDFHQSAQWIAASPNIPKWVVSTIFSLGTTGACSPLIASRVQVYMLDVVSGFRYRGQAFVPVPPSGPAKIQGDVAWVPSGAAWYPVDLPTLAVGNPSPLPPIVETQTSIDGRTYKMSQVDSKHFELNAQGGAVKLNYYCPLEPVNRQQMAAFLIKAMNFVIQWCKEHPGEQLPAATSQCFEDVPLDYPSFGQVINQLGEMGIAVGKPETAEGQSPCAS